MPKSFSSEFIFCEVDGRFISVNETPILLADFLLNHDVIIDDNAQFVRIIRYEDYGKFQLEYRAYNAC